MRVSGDVSSSTPFRPLPEFTKHLFPIDPSRVILVPPFFLLRFRSPLVSTAFQFSRWFSVPNCFPNACFEMMAAFPYTIRFFFCFSTAPRNLRRVAHYRLTDAAPRSRERVVFFSRFRCPPDRPSDRPRSALIPFPFNLLVALFWSRVHKPTVTRSNWREDHFFPRTLSVFYLFLIASFRSFSPDFLRDRVLDLAVHI